MSEILRNLCPFKSKQQLSSLTYHPDSLQVHLSSPKLFPVVMPVAFSFGDSAVLSCQLKHVLHKRTPTHLVHWDLDRPKARKTTLIIGNSNSA